MRINPYEKIYNFVGIYCMVYNAWYILYGIYNTVYTILYIQYIVYTVKYTVHYSGVVWLPVRSEFQSGPVRSNLVFSRTTRPSHRGLAAIRVKIISLSDKRKHAQP